MWYYWWAKNVYVWKKVSSLALDWSVCRGELVRLENFEFISHSCSSWLILIEIEKNILIEKSFYLRINTPFYLRSLGGASCFIWTSSKVCKYFHLTINWLSTLYFGRLSNHCWNQWIIYFALHKAFSIWI